MKARIGEFNELIIIFYIALQIFSSLISKRKTTLYYVLDDMDIKSKN